MCFVGASPALWRLRDENGDGFIDSRVAISEGYNVHPAFGGHGISGVTLGPDGRIYWEVGDMGFDVVDQSGRRWSYPNQGAVLRANPDGSDFEVFATGIRNLQEFAFDDYGNLISVDNDGDHPGETERLVYLPEGSDSGWRANWQYGKSTDPANNRYNVWMDEGMFKPRFEGQPAHITPPIAPTTRVRREWSTTRERRCPTSGGIISSWPASGVGNERRDPGFPAESRRGPGSRWSSDTGPAAGHPDGRPDVRPRWRAVSGRLDHEDGTRKAMAASGRSIRRRRRRAPRGTRSGRCCRESFDAARRRRSRAAAAAPRHAGAAEGPVRAGPPRRRHHVPR